MAGKAHLVDVAEKVGSTSVDEHTKDESAEEIRKANARKSAEAREK